MTPDHLTRLGFRTKRYNQAGLALLFDLGSKLVPLGGNPQVRWPLVWAGQRGHFARFDCLEHADAHPRAHGQIGDRPLLTGGNIGALLRSRKRQQRFHGRVTRIQVIRQQEHALAANQSIGSGEHLLRQYPAPCPAQPAYALPSARSSGDVNDFALVAHGRLVNRGGRKGRG
jgi:hypothetical protein